MYRLIVIYINSLLKKNLKFEKYTGQLERKTNFWALPAEPYEDESFPDGITGKSFTVKLTSAGLHDKKSIIKSFQIIISTYGIPFGETKMKILGRTRIN